MEPEQPAKRGWRDRRSVLSGAASVAIAAAIAGAGPAVAAGASGRSENASGIPALARVTVPAGALRVDQRQAMVTGITRVLAGVTGVGPSGLPYLTVLVGEAVDCGWGVNAQGYVASDVSALIAGRPLSPGAAPGRAE